MTFYESDSESAIIEGGEHVVINPSLPDISAVPDGFTIVSETDQTPMLSAWDEAAKLGIDVEEYFEG